MAKLTSNPNPASATWFCLAPVLALAYPRSPHSFSLWVKGVRSTLVTLKLGSHAQSPNLTLLGRPVVPSLTPLLVGRLPLK